MALWFDDALTADEATIEVTGRHVEVLPPPDSRLHAQAREIEHLRELLAVRESQIDSLETMAWAWRSQATTEARLRREDQRSAYDRERDLIRVIHTQMTELEVRRIRRRWWRREA